MDHEAQTKFARSGDVHIAYQVAGGGTRDLLLVDDWVHHVELAWEVPDLARFMRRLSAIGRLIHFDRRGTGISDPVSIEALPDLETQVEDVIAVLDAAGSQQASVLGMGEGGLLAILVAALHPERCSRLVLYASAARRTASEDHPWGIPPEALDPIVEQIERGLTEGGSGIETIAPSRIGDAEFAAALDRMQRSAVRPGTVGHYFKQSFLADVRDILSTIRVPTLVLQRTEDRTTPVELAQELADGIPDTKLVLSPGSDHLFFSGDADSLVDEIEEFVTGSRRGIDPDRVLASLLFTDIVASTEKAASVGDRRWRALLDRHERVVRPEIRRFGGREISTTGDGFFASFDGPGHAVRCALSLIEVTAREGLEIRAGVHTGEAEIRGSDLGGLAVHIAARVAALARSKEVLVSSTVKDLLVGGGLTFAERGEHELKGVPGTWTLFAARYD